MSEVKRIFTPGFTELPGCGDRCWSSAIDVDQWGARIEVYGMTSAEATELRDEVLRSITDFDAQRLRADTAEAELAKLRESHAALIEDRARFPDRPDFVGDMISAHIGNLKAGKESSDNYARNYILKLDVAEQRIADLSQLLFYASERLSKVRYVGLHKRIEAALSTASPATINQQGEEA